MARQPPDATSEAAPRSSPLEACHERLGARFTEFAGWRLPLRYGSELAEHQAVRRAGGVFDLSHMAELAVTGPAAAAALDGALVGWFDPLPVGRARYTVCCADDGGVVDDLVVYRTDPTRFVVVANAANRAAVADALAAQVAGHDADLVDETDDTALVAIQGPVAATVLGRLVDGAAAASLGGLAPYGCTAVEVRGVPCLVGRTGYTGEDGFECFVPSEAGATVFDGLLEAGAPDGVVPAGLAARDTLRLEAGMALYGHELTRAVTPFEAGLGRLVRFDKPGDFVGRAALDDRRAAGPRAVLVGLVGEGRRAAREGYRVVDPGDPAVDVGAVTSGALSPTLQRPVAMAYVRPDRARTGEQLLVDVRGDRAAYEVTALPFYCRTDRNGASR